MATLNLGHSTKPGEMDGFYQTLRRQRKQEVLRTLAEMAGLRRPRRSSLLSDGGMKHRDETGWFGWVKLGDGGTRRGYTPERDETLVAFATRVLGAEGVTA